MEWNRVGGGRDREGGEETFGDVFRLPVVARGSRSLSRECESKERKKKKEKRRRREKRVGERKEE